MIEIILLISLTRQIGNSAKAKGLAPGKYKGMLVGFWFLGEVVGFLLGSALELGLGAALLGLVGAATGAVVAFSALGRAAAQPTSEDEELLLAFD